MNMRRHSLVGMGLVLVTAAWPAEGFGQETAEVSLGVDLVSRYVWRGIKLGDAPSVQPSVSLGKKGFEVGAWGSYTLSNDMTGGDEIDLWVGYSIELPDGGSLGLIVTDYYLPNSGVEFSNFNNYDHEDGPGAHILEIGGTITFPSLPVTLAGYVNFHNDEGHNVYLQADYPVMVGETEVNLFAGATPGSEENPDFYGTEDFSFLNLGFTAIREISITDQFSLPLSGSWIINPNLDIAYFVIGLSL